MSEAPLVARQERRISIAGHYRTEASRYDSITERLRVGVREIEFLLGENQLCPMS